MLHHFRVAKELTNAAGADFIAELRAISALLIVLLLANRTMRLTSRFVSVNLRPDRFSVPYEDGALM